MKGCQFLSMLKHQSFLDRTSYEHKNNNIDDFGLYGTLLKGKRNE